MSYNRLNAIKYAEEHWKTNCHDGVISLLGSFIPVEPRSGNLG